ncbi:MAG: thioredoxin family protein [Bacteroidota bacterium]
MRFSFTIGFLFFISSYLSAQNDKVKLYNPGADAKSEIAAAAALADSAGKNVLLQIGGNWCSWCIKFNRFCISDKEIDTLLQNNYIIVHVNYSNENKNLEILKSFDFPQRFGFPVIVILDGKGNRLHTQDTGLLELGDSYDRKKVITFLSNWTPASLKPDNYEK